MEYLLWGLFLVLLIGMMVRGGCCGGKDHRRERHGKGEPSGRQAGIRQIDAVTDPVCGMIVDKEVAAHTLERAGTTYYFCSSDCYQDFKAAPQRYLLEQQPSN